MSDVDTDDEEKEPRVFLPLPVVSDADTAFHSGKTWKRGTVLPMWNGMLRVARSLLSTRLYEHMLNLFCIHLKPERYLCLRPLKLPGSIPNAATTASDSDDDPPITLESISHPSIDMKKNLELRMRPETIGVELLLYNSEQEFKDDPYKRTKHTRAKYRWEVRGTCDHLRLKFLECHSPSHHAFSM
jgi:hypothetical protein